MHRISRRTFVTGLAASAALPFVGQARGADGLASLKFMTEEYPPYNYAENGQLRGISVDVVVEMFARVDSGHARSSIDMLPWARGYNLTLQRGGHALFSTTRTADREELFKWVGPFVPTVVGLTAHRDRKLNVDTLEDLFQLRIGVVKDDVGQLLLKAVGFPEQRMEVVVSNDQNYRKLVAGRLDAIAYETEVTRWGLQQMNVNPDDYEVVHELKRSDLYLALHRQTPEAIVAELQGAFDSMVADGTYQAILSGYHTS
ncbi:MAG: ABC transporter substrate-binding protein [Pseudomonadota bacterium]